MRMNLIELSHSLKGLCGIFRLAEGGLPEYLDIRLVFAEGVKRMLATTLTSDKGRT